MSPESVSIPLAVGAVVECRTRRADGTRERGRVVELNGREATIEIENPRPRAPRRRRLPLGGSVGCGRGGVGHYRVIRLADGRAVHYQAGGAVFLPAEGS